MPASFHEILFPLDVALGARGGPERRTEIVTTGSGLEERNARWAHARRKWNAGLRREIRRRARGGWSAFSRNGAAGFTAFAGATGSIILPARRTFRRRPISSSARVTDRMRVFSW